MLYKHFCACLLVVSFVSAPAFAKNETLAERGKRMCEEAGVALEDCTILPPALRGPGPDSTATPTSVATVTPEPRPISALGPGPAAFGTGKYGWCEDCTSLLAAAPVTPWEDYGGRSFQSVSDNDDRRSANASRSSPSGTSGDGDDGRDGDDGSDGGDGRDGNDGSDGGDGRDGDSGQGGEICD